MGSRYYFCELKVRFGEAQASSQNQEPSRLGGASGSGSWLPWEPSRRVSNTIEAELSQSGRLSQGGVLADIDGSWKVRGWGVVPWLVRCFLVGSGGGCGVIAADGGCIGQAGATGGWGGGCGGCLKAVVDYA
jgi:hypothetical protein